MTFFLILSALCAVWFLAVLAAAFPRPRYSDDPASWKESGRAFLCESRGGVMLVMALSLLTLLAGGAMLAAADQRALPYYGISAALFAAFGVAGAAACTSKISRL